MASPLVTPVILSGGAGTRLWPLSRSDYPKQFLPLAGEASMLQDTAVRVTGAQFAAPLVVCNEDHRFIVAEQLRSQNHAPQTILLEPTGRNTAPAVAIAALWLVAQDADAAMLVLPSDHSVRDAAAFRIAVGDAAKLAGDHLVTFGIKPSGPETGFGYIERGAELTAGSGAYSVASFHEKPDAETAGTLVARGDLWNSGMFLFRAATLIEEMEALAPEILAACRAALAGAKEDLDFLRLAPDAFAKAPAISLDHAVMEKTQHAAVLPVDFGWSDVGSWHALWEIGDKDEDGNVVVGDVAQIDSTNCYLRSNGTLVAAIGLSDYLVVASEDAVLVAPRNEAQQVGALVAQLADASRREVVHHPQIFRPWGWYQTLSADPGFHVKRITVHAGGRVSLRRHRHTAQHWVIAGGTALVTLEGVEHSLAPGESIAIPAGAAHALAAQGKDALSLIEVQAGPNAGRDEFERLE